MPLISSDELAKAINLEGTPGLARVLMEVSKLNAVNDVFEKIQGTEGLDFIDFALETLGIQVEIDPKDLKKIPKKGGFIAVANHPYGGIEGLILLKLLCSVRSDSKLMVNFILNKIPNLQEYFVAVNPFEDLKEKSSVGGIISILKLIKEGIPVGIFPAGEVSTFNLKTKRVIDRIWHPVVGKLIKKTDVPVLPVYFDGNNGLLFQILSLIHPKLRTAKLPSELVNKSGKTIKVRIGHPIQAEDLKHFSNSASALNYVRSRTYALEMGFDSTEKQYSPKNIFKVFKKEKEIIAPIANLDNEVATLSNYMVCAEGEYEVYLAPFFAIPQMIKEIGRLREVTFRGVGEGTGKEIDLDHYDVFYQHLFVWHKSEKCLVGAYRIGNGAEILKNRGSQAFYINELFKIEAGFYEVMQSGVELGRSWVRKEFQNKPLPLFLLWRALILHFVNNPHLKYLFGPVSISNDYTNCSKTLMVEFIKKNYFDDHLAQFVKPRKQFKVKGLKNINISTLADFGNNIKTLDSIIADIDRKHNKIPVLLRQYIAMSGRIVAFNVDPKFADCLDGLLVLNFSNMPPEMLEKLKG